MIPVPLGPNKKEPSPINRLFWSPTQEVIDSPCTKSIKNRKSDIKARALLDKFIEIKLREDDELNKRNK